MILAIDEGAVNVAYNEPFFHAHYLNRNTLKEFFFEGGDFDNFKH